MPAPSSNPRITRRPLVIAHRGGAPHDIENTLTAFQHGLEVGSDLIECDLRTSSDGAIVLYHDAQVAGVRVHALPLSELRRRIPTLVTFNEFLAWAAQQQRFPRVVLDLKEPALDRALAPYLGDAAFRRAVIVTTQNMGSIRRLRRAWPDLRVGLSRGQAAAGARPAYLRPGLVGILRPLLLLLLLPQLRWSKANVVVLHHRLVTRNAVERFHRAGVRVYVWTVDDCLEAQALGALGVDYIASNRPWLLRGCLGLFEDDQSSPSG